MKTDLGIRMRVLLLYAFCASIAIAGDLTPPAGPVGPTMKRLDQVEPRTPIGSETTPGDAEALFVIDQPGSYYLTGPIAGLAGKGGIKIATSDVQLDLSGYAVYGRPGSTTGVFSAPGASSIGILNGSILGWGGSGLDLSSTIGLTIRDVASRNNGGRGIWAGTQSQLDNCYVQDNTGHGIEAGLSSTIVDCRARDNGRSGITVAGAATISRCQAFGNGNSGIDAGHGSSVSDCQCYFNGQNGVRADHTCTIARCQVRDNFGSGIRVLNDCFVLENLCSSNGVAETLGAGVQVVERGNRIDSNLIENNSVFGLFVEYGSNFILRNTARANGSGAAYNYAIGGQQMLGPIVTNAADVATANAWANFSL